MLDLITSWNTNTLLSKTKTPDYAFPYNYCHTVTRNRGNPSGHRWKLLSESGKCTQTATGTVEQWQQSMFCRRPLLVLWATWPDDGRPDWQPDQPSSPERAALQQWPMSKGNEWATDVAWGPEVRLCLHVCSPCSRLLFYQTADGFIRLHLLHAANAKRSLQVLYTTSNWQLYGVKVSLNKHFSTLWNRLNCKHCAWWAFTEMNKCRISTREQNCAPQHHDERLISQWSEC